MQVIDVINVLSPRGQVPMSFWAKRSWNAAPKAFGASSGFQSQIPVRSHKMIIGSGDVWKPGLALRISLRRLRADQGFVRTCCIDEIGYYDIVTENEKID